MTDYLPELSFMKKEGCEKCGGTGYKGRLAFHELLIGTKMVKDAIKKSTGVEHLRELAIEEGNEDTEDGRHTEGLPRDYRL